MQNATDPAIEAPSSLFATTVLSILQEYRDGRDPLVTYCVAHQCLVALGRPLSEKGVRDLMVDARTLNNRSVARLRIL